MTGLSARLAESLSDLSPVESAALVNYPNHLNLGDHLIWAGAVLFLREVLHVQRLHVADADGYSGGKLEASLDRDAPIFVHGGGSLGDLWRGRQDFHEILVASHPGRRIVFLPQTVFFRDPALAERAANVFNAHGGVTLYARDAESLRTATSLFDRCHVRLAPDMAFQLEGLLTDGLSRDVPPDATVLYLSRRDEEARPPRALDLPETRLVTSDWVSLERRWRWGHSSVPFSIPLARLYREVFQRGVLRPREWAARRRWMASAARHPRLRLLVDHPFHRFSLGLVHDGMRQVGRHRLVVTDRLHGHILCTLMGIPHVLLPNSYFKNAAFHEAWTKGLPHGRFEP